MAEEKEAKKADVKEAKADKAKKADKKAKKEKKSRKNPFKAIGAFFKGVRSEGKKVVWPKAAEVFKNTVIVLVVILILGVIIYGIDFGLSKVVQWTKKQATESTTVAEETDAATSDDVLTENTEEDTAEPTVTAEETSE